MHSDPGQRNPVLTMRLSREHPKHAQWFVNAQPVAPREYDGMMAHYHIQVNNLCQFLSQFRVASFSGESPEQRLKSTESAIGYDGIVQDHERLAAAGVESSAITETVSQRAALIAKLTESRNELQDKLSRMEEALDLKLRVELLQNVIAIQKYNHFKQEIRSLRSQVDAAQLRLEQFDIEMQPIHHEIEATQRQVDEARANLASNETVNQSAREFASSRQRLLNCQQRVKSIATTLERAQKQIERLTAQVEALDNELADAKLATSQAHRTVQEKGLDQLTFDGLLADSNRRQDEYTREAQKVQRLRDAEQDKTRQLTFKKNELHHHKQRLAFLQDQEARDQAHRSANASQSDDPNVNYPARNPEGVRRFWADDRGLLRNVKAVQQLQERSRLEKSVILPAILSLNVTDSRILRVLGMAVRNEQLHKFVCRTEHDQHTLATVAAKENLQLRTTVMTGGSRKRAFNDTQMQTLRAAGFDGVISDFLDGPPVMLDFMRSLGLDSFLISFKPLSPNATTLIRQVSERSGAGMLRCADTQYMYTFSQSRYGQRQVTEETRKLPPRIQAWTQFMLQNNSMENHLHQQQENGREVERLLQSITASEATITLLKEELDESSSRIQVAQERSQDLRKAAKELTIQYQREKSLRDRLRNAQANEAALKESLAVKMQELNREKQSLQPLVSKLTEAIAEMSLLSEPPVLQLPTILAASHEKSLLASIHEDHQNKLNLLNTALAIRRQVPEEEVRKRRRELQEAKDSQQETSAAAKAATRWLRANNKESEAVQLANEMNVNELRDEMNRLQASVTLYNQRSDSPASIRTKLASTTEHLTYEEEQQRQSLARLAELGELNDSVRSRWEAEIRLIVSNISEKFSELFREVGCRGYVELATPDPLAVGTWGVDIFVSFRPDEEPSKLSKMRQSGGERAVTTAIYLLSLQNLARAPFRVLDEINQGMDENNERITMKFFVDLSCNLEDDSSQRQQYFLVTPKLISNMPWHKNMNIVFIFGGETIMDTKKLLKPTEAKKRSRAMLEASSN